MRSTVVIHKHSNSKEEDIICLDATGTQRFCTDPYDCTDPYIVNFFTDPYFRFASGRFLAALEGIQLFWASLSL